MNSTQTKHTTIYNRTSNSTSKASTDSIRGQDHDSPVFLSANSSSTILRIVEVPGMPRLGVVREHEGRDPIVDTNREDNAFPCRVNVYVALV